MAAVIPALEPDLRPAYITDRGPVAGSFIRTGDGDKRLTHYEVDRMCESRMQPVWDTEHVSEASVTDLDAAVLKTMVERNRAMTPSVFGGMAGEEILVKTGVLAEGAGRLVPTLGGLLAAGVYPQAASGTPWNAASMAVKGDPMADLVEDLAADGTTM